VTKRFDLTVFFALLGSVGAEAACRTLMRFTPGLALSYICDKNIFVKLTPK